MSEKTNIQWADHTGSPWFGCTEVNEDCANCYARELAKGRMERLFRDAYKKTGVENAATRSVWGKGAPRIRSKSFWSDARKWNNTPWVCDACGTATALPANCQRTVFTCSHCNVVTQHHRARMFPSLCDWLDEEAPIEWFADFLQLIFETHNLIWMLLTKRPELWRERLCKVSNRILSERMAGWDRADRVRVNAWISDWLNGTAPKNVWIFVSASNQKNADLMIPHGLAIPAVIHGVSAEPLLGPIDFEKAAEKAAGVSDVDMIIFGGESTQGKPARRCNMEWIRSGVQQCKAAGVKAYVKQLGSNPFADGGLRLNLKDKKGGDINEWPGDLRVREWPEAAYQ